MKRTILLFAATFVFTLGPVRAQTPTNAPVLVGPETVQKTFPDLMKPNTNAFASQKQPYIITHSDKVTELDVFYSDIADLIGDEFDGKNAPTDEEMLYGAIKGLVRSTKDPYSAFLTPGEAKILAEDDQGKFGGIGASLLYENDHVVVSDVWHDGPAEKLGIKKGDKFFGIDGILVRSLSETEVLLKLRGPIGSKVRVLVLQEGETEPKELEIERAEVFSPKLNVSWEAKGTFVYVKLPKFSEATMKEMDGAAKEILDKYKDLPIVLDLRGNGGGDVGACVGIAAIWLKSGSRVYEVSSRGGEMKPAVFDSDAAPPLLGRKTVILTDGFTASASEILVGALKDNDKSGLVTTIGEKTFGKGVGQIVTHFKDGSWLVLTSFHWYTSLGRAIHGVGFEPDIAVAPAKQTVGEQMIEGLTEDAVLNRAEEFLRTGK